MRDVSDKHKQPPDNPAQSKRFVDMAHEVEADEDPGSFERAFTKIIHAPATAAGASSEPSASPSKRKNSSVSKKKPG